MVGGVTTTWGTVLKGHGMGKAENHCSRHVWVPLVPFGKRCHLIDLRFPDAVAEVVKALC